MKRIVWCCLVILAGALAGAAQAVKAPESWDKLAAKADEVVNVNLDRRMLQFAARFMDKDDSGARDLVAKLKGIYVRSLEFRNPGAFTEADVQPIRAQLQGPEWSHIVEVDSKTDREKVEIYVKTVNNQTLGMVILSQAPEELTLVNLDGPLDPEDLDKISGNFGIPRGIHAPRKTPAPAPPTVKK